MAAAMTEDEVRATIEMEIGLATGWDGDELSALRTNALQYYYGELPKRGLEGTSAVVSADVADMVEAVVAQMMPGFTGDAVVEFDANDAADEDQAQEESDIINFIILEQNRGFVMLQEAVRDALLLRNGWIKVWLDDAETVTIERFPGVAKEAVAAIEAMDRADNVELEVETEENEADSSLVDAKVMVTRRVKSLRLKSVDPTLMSWEAAWDSTFLPGIRFLAERDWVTRTDLILQGFSKEKVNSAPAGISQDVQGTDTQQRYTRPGGGGIAGDSRGEATVTDKSMQYLDVYEVYIRLDEDRDGIAEQRRVILAGGVILEDEVVDFIPYATGTPFLQAHSINGLGLYDKLQQTQDIKTAGLRNWLDNQKAVNTSRLAVDEKTTNINDATNNRPGGILRTKGPPGNSIMPVPTVDVGPSALMLLEYADKMRSEAGGASLDLQAAELQLAGETAHGVERQMSSKEQLAAMMSRTLAETLIRTTWELTHKAARSWLNAPVEARRGGREVSSNPAEWGARARLNMSSGLSVAERATMQGQLATIIQQQAQAMQSGLAGVITDLPQMYNALLDWSRAGLIDNGERYWLNPQSPEAQQRQKQNQAMAQQQQQQAVQIAAMAASAEQNAAQIKAIQDQTQANQDRQFDYWKEALNAAVEEMKLAIPNETDQLQEFGMVRSITDQPGAQGAGNAGR